MQRYPGHLEAAQTMAFVTLCTSELIRAFAARSEHRSVFAIGVFSNRWMVGAVAVSFALVLAVVYVPFLAPFFDAVPPTAGDWLVMLPFFFASPIAMELLKLHFRSRKAPAPAGARAAVAPAPVVTPSLPGSVEAGRPILEGHAMSKILVPVGGSGNDRFALQEIVRRFMNDTAIEVHLLNVQRPFSSYVTMFSSRRNRQDYHREQAEKALAPAKAMLDRYSIPYAVHMEVGHQAETITAMARRLHCTEIVMATARKNSLTRLVESSVTERVIELTSVPVEVIAGDSMSKWERYGIPAAIGTALAMLLAFED
jgi:nucleotide-binding universal stress UspA family protein